MQYVWHPPHTPCARALVRMHICVHIAQLLHTPAHLYAYIHTTVRNSNTYVSMQHIPDNACIGSQHTHGHRKYALCINTSLTCIYETCTVATHSQPCIPICTHTHAVTTTHVHTLMHNMCTNNNAHQHDGYNYYNHTHQVQYTTHNLTRNAGTDWQHTNRMCVSTHTYIHTPITDNHLTSPPVVSTCIHRYMHNTYTHGHRTYAIHNVCAIPAHSYDKRNHLIC